MAKKSRKKARKPAKKQSAKRNTEVAKPLSGEQYRATDSKSEESRTAKSATNKVAGTAKPRTANDRRPETTAQRSARQHAERKKRRKRLGRTLVPAVVFGLVFALLVGLYTFLSGTSAGNFSARLTQFGDVSFRYDADVLGKSPVCGCLEPPANEWRGATFAARTVDVSAGANEAKAVGFIVTAADVDADNYESDFYEVRLDSVAVRIRVKEGGAIDAKALANGNYEQVGQVLDSPVAYNGPREVSTRGTVHVTLGGANPVIGYKSMPDSTVTLTNHAQGLPAKPQLTLTERFEGTHTLPANFDPPKQKPHTKAADTQGAPFADFLGPKLAFWTTDSNARVTGAWKGSSATTERGYKVVTAVVVPDPSFAVRLGIVPSRHLPTTREFYDKRDRDTWTIPVDNVSSGAIKIQATDLLNDAEFREMYERITKAPLVWRPYTVDGESGKLQYRYPPIPNNSGFNVFGPFASIKVSDTIGSVRIGNKDETIGAPTVLELRGITNFRLLRDDLSVAIPLKTESDQTDAQFKGVSEVFIGGSDRTLRVDNLSSTWNAIILTLSVVSGLATLAAAATPLVQYARKAREKREG